MAKQVTRAELLRLRDEEGARVRLKRSAPRPAPAPAPEPPRAEAPPPPPAAPQPIEVTVSTAALGAELRETREALLDVLSTLGPVPFDAVVTERDEANNIKRVRFTPIQA